MTRVRMHGIVEGIVQGVGFRYFAQSEAGALGVDGWVKNLRDGSVEFEAEGEEGAVNGFIDALRNNHPWSRVDDIKLNSLPFSNTEDGFKIKF